MKLLAGCLIVNILSLNFFNTGSIVPDYFTCFDGCNTCYFRIRKIGSFNKIIDEGCTELFCLGEIPETELEEFQKCSNNWLFSRSIGYDRLSNFANNCVNGYRNFTYVEHKQEETPGFSLSDLQTVKYTREALTEGIVACRDLEIFLQRKANFNQKAIDNFGVYLREPRFTNPYDYSYTVTGMLESIQNQKSIFDYLSENHHNFSNLVTSKMIDKFSAGYASYLDDRAKYGEETFEQRRDRLFNNQQF